MAFLDNSGDIILDAVLTDTGRYRLAKGDGSFKIAKFALGDDEIDYSLYNKDHPSGSAYYDLDILQTPILEACTDNASALKSQLLSIAATDHLFLPVIKLYENSNTTTVNSISYSNNKYYVVVADLQTEQTELFNSTAERQGVFFTHNKSSTAGNAVVLHQGLDTPKISPSIAIPTDLGEKSYIIEMDNRLGSLLGSDLTELDRSYIDDDQIASYLLTMENNGSLVTSLGVATTTEDEAKSSIRGPRGTSVTLRLAASLELQTSTYLFQELGSTIKVPDAPGGVEYYIIDTNVRITGVTTGYRIDVPIRYIKKI